ncbi:hypothetical protein [Labilithrix luteola]|nr:hypothetical protein [Labilithrix luteola]
MTDAPRESPTGAGGAGASRGADALVRTTRSLPEATLRAAYLKSLLLANDVVELAACLDIVCGRAEQAEAAPREVLVALVDALNDPACKEVVQQLREQAASAPHLALERLVRQPLRVPATARDVPDPEDDRIPDYGRGRPLTLGERKSLARRPDRDMLERLLRDPHPDVIRQLLVNPRLTEDDVLRMAARRPSRPDVLSEIARSSRWAHRPRLRMALVLNPDTPLEIAGPILGLLLRHELRLVATSPTVAPAVRALALEHLQRRPPGQFSDDDDVLQ